MSLHFYDAHNHLQDERFGGRQSKLLATCALTGVTAMVVNGSCEQDWPQVLALARRAAVPAAAGAQSVPTPPQSGVPAASTSEPNRTTRANPTLTHASTLKRAEARAPAAAAEPTALRIIPSFGYHPWYIRERTAGWQKNLVRFLDLIPSAVGEIGLDRWKPGLSYEAQEEVFIAQLRLAAEKNRPVSIHCLQVWGRMLELLQTEPRPARGFLLHSYGGPKEMVKPFANLGAYFSLPGYYAHERKARQREAFQHVPAERLLIETDAPDQLLPDGWRAVGGGHKCSGTAQIYSLTDSATGKPLNHPANLRAVYEFAAELFGEPVASLATRVEHNFSRLFGGP